MKKNILIKKNLNRLVKSFSIFLIAPIFFYGCVSTSERIERINNQDHNTCANSYGLKVESTAYANCRYNLSNIRAREEQLNQQRSQALMEYGRYISKCGISGTLCR